MQAVGSPTHSSGAVAFAVQVGGKKEVRAVVRKLGIGGFPGIFLRESMHQARMIGQFHGQKG